MLWQIRFFPFCTHHVFLSHCREDRDSLVFPLFRALNEHGIIAWLDRHDYPYGRASFEALRDGMLKCRHVVFLITQKMLSQPRGWGIVELAWAELLQENLREAGGVLQTVALPLFFLDQGHPRLMRSAWQTLHDRAVFYRRRDGGRVAWAARQVSAFVLREAQRGLDNALWLQQDAHARERLGARQGLLDRITARHPAPIPVSEAP
jgi:hypothetical protein